MKRGGYRPCRHPRRQTIEERYAHWSVYHFAGGHFPLPDPVMGCTRWLAVHSGRSSTGPFWHVRDPRDPGPWRHVNRWTKR